MYLETARGPLTYRLTSFVFKATSCLEARFEVHLIHPAPPLARSKGMGSIKWLLATVGVLSLSLSLSLKKKNPNRKVQSRYRLILFGPSKGTGSTWSQLGIQ